MSTPEERARELAPIFKAAWHDADSRGETGGRTIAGLTAVLAALEPCPNECDDGRIECWSPGGPCSPAERATPCDLCGPCFHCRPGEHPTDDRPTPTEETP